MSSLLLEGREIPYRSIYAYSSGKKLHRVRAILGHRRYQQNPADRRLCLVDAWGVVVRHHRRQARERVTRPRRWSPRPDGAQRRSGRWALAVTDCVCRGRPCRSEEHTSELQSRLHLVCRLLLEKNKTRSIATAT